MKSDLTGINDEFSTDTILIKCAEKKDVRIQLVMSRSEAEVLDAWRASRRIWSRSAAIRRLIEEGIGRDEGDQSTDPKGSK